MNSVPLKQRPWTLMVYMAGDNGKIFNTAAGPMRLMAEMTTVGYKDLWKMGQVGTTDACAVTCLFDTQQGSYLVEVRKGNGLSKSLIQPLGEINMGDPQNLRNFIIRAVQRLSSRALCAHLLESRPRLAGYRYLFAGPGGIDCSST